MVYTRTDGTQGQVPFRKDTKLLNLSHNQLQAIDLAPLSSCSNLQGLDLQNNQLQDGHSWLQIPRGIYDVLYERPSHVYDWSFLHEVAVRDGKDWRVQQDILSAMGLGEYGFIDTDLHDFLVALPADEDLPVIRERVREHIIKQIVITIDERGTTTGLDVENLMTQHGDIVARTQRILELRKHELQEVQVGIDQGVADLRELYLTAYGYQVLSALGVKLESGKDKLVEVTQAFEDLGFALRTGDASIPAVKMSDELKQAIWWIIKNRRKSWEDIQ